MPLRRIAFGVASLSAARVFQLASSFVAIPFLARMLTPTDFGLAALALSMVMFFTLIGDAGLGRSLVRIDASDTEAWSSAFWAVGLLTLGLSACIFLLSWPAASFFNEPRLVPIMMTLALAPLLMGVTEIPAASLLQREKFQWLAVAEFVGALAGVIVALAVAFSGGGAWALVWQHLTQRIGKGIVIQAASRLRPRLVLNFARLREHLRFMLDTSAWSLTMFFSRQADTLIVGKVLGAATLGLYNIAVRVMQLPVSIFGGSLHSAVYPRLVQVRDDNEALRRLILLTTLVQTMIVFPAVAAVAAASDAVFTLLLSDRWVASASIFTLLAGAAAIQTVVAINGSLLQAIGRTGARLRLTAEYAGLLALSALIASQFGVHAVALGCTLTTLFYLPRLLHLYVGPIGLKSADFLRVLATPALIALLIYAGHRALFAVVDLNNWAEVGVAALETFVGYSALYWIERRRIAAALKDLRAMFAPGGGPKPSPPPIPREMEHGGGVLSGDLVRVLAFGVLRTSALYLPRRWALSLVDLIALCFALLPIGARTRRSFRAAFGCDARTAAKMTRAWLRQPFRDYVIACRVTAGREDPKSWQIDSRSMPALMRDPDQSCIIAAGHFCREAMSGVYLPSVHSKRLATVIAPLNTPGVGLRQLRIRMQLGTMMEAIKRIRYGDIDIVEVKGASSVTRMLSHLRQPGHAVVIAADAPHEGANGHQRAYAGHGALSFALGAVRLARLSKRPIVVCMPHLSHDGRIVLEWSAPLAPPTTAEEEVEALDAILDIFERAIGERPEQYLLPLGSDRRWNSATQTWTARQGERAPPPRAPHAPSSRRKARADT